MVRVTCFVKPRVEFKGPQEHRCMALKAVHPTLIVHCSVQSLRNRRSFEGATIFTKRTGNIGIHAPNVRNLSDLCERSLVEKENHKFAVKLRKAFGLPPLRRRNPNALNELAGLLAHLADEDTEASELLREARKRE